MAGKQVYFEDVQIGDELPVVSREKVRLHDIVRWCGAVDDYFDFHYDEAYAKSIGLPNMLVPGPILGAYLMSAITSWLGEGGTFKQLSQRNASMTHPGDAAVFKGKVANKYLKDGENCVELEVWLENQRGEVTNPGKAVATLPSRPAK